MRESAAFRLGTISAKKGRWRPSANLFQLVASKLAEIEGQNEWKLEEDGAFGDDTDEVARSIQAHHGLSVDGEVGSDTWHAITPSLGSWRPPLRLRIAECQCTWEAGTQGYGFTGIIEVEGWWNWGIWNVNRGSAKTLTTLGGASHLHAQIDAADAAGTGGRAIAEDVAKWFNSRPGRETQVGRYFLEQTIKPSLKNLIKTGWSVESLGFESLEHIVGIESVDEMDEHLATVSPFFERLILHACDVTVNSGAGGYLPKKTPRQWDRVDGMGMEWPHDRLPFKDECKQIFADTFGCTISSDTQYCTSDSRDTYAEALKTCLWQLCETDEQRISLAAELQARCVIDRWRDGVIRRRRAAAWVDGYSFQGSSYCMREDFGIGI